MIKLLFVQGTTVESAALLTTLQSFSTQLSIYAAVGSHDAWFFANSGAYTDAIIAADTIADEELVELLCLTRKNNPRTQLILYGFCEDHRRMNRLAATKFIPFDKSPESINESLMQLLRWIPTNLQEPDPSIQRQSNRWDPVVSTVIHIAKVPTMEQNPMIRQILNRFTWQNASGVRFRWQRYLLQLHKENGTLDRDELLHIAEQLQNQLAAIGLAPTYVLFSPTLYSYGEGVEFITLMDYAIDFLLARNIRVAFLTPELLSQFSSALPITQLSLDLKQAIEQSNSDRAIALSNELQQQLHSGAIAPLMNLRSLVSDCILMIYNKQPHLDSREMMADLSRVCRCDEWRLLFPLLHHWLERLPSPALDSAGSTRAHIVQQILQQIASADLLTLSPEMIANSLYRSPSYINEVFKQEMNISLVKYISELRLKRAAELIRESNRKIIDISKEIGYSNYTYFCQIFRKRFGTSPAKYRTSLPDEAADA